MRVRRGGGAAGVAHLAPLHPRRAETLHMVERQRGKERHPPGVAAEPQARPPPKGKGLFAQQMIARRGEHAVGIE